MKETKVRLNYSFASTKDVYSDGEVEEELLNIVQNNTRYDDIIFSTRKFPIFYHLSKERELIVSSMEIKKTDVVLEIGSGCGAITGALAEKAEKVHCVELSERRSKINSYKNSDKENVEIFIGNYQDVELPQKYDVITLIGVFEYAVHYFHTSCPYKDFLCDVLGKLKPNGRLYIAIENRLGAKYFSGCVEDHAGTLCEGIMGYPNYTNAKTFSYNEWCELLDKVNIKKYKFFYPYPDYKFPRMIFSDDKLPTKELFIYEASNYVDDRMKFFDENLFFKSLDIKNEFKIFSNSFLICITK